MRRIGALALSSFMLVAAQAADADPVGFVATANGDVTLQQGGAWKAATRDDSVEIGDSIRTGTGASAKIVLVDDTLLQVDEETELKIETFHVGDAATKDVSIVRQARGRLRATVGDAFGGSTKIEVHVPTAAVGVKGTDFEVIDGQFWEACLHSGGIRVSNDFGEAFPEPGECVYAYGDKAPGDAHPNKRTPLDVDDPGRDRGDEPVDQADVLEPIQVQVGAPPESGDPPALPDDDPYDSTTGDATEDELEIFEEPEVENDQDYFEG